MTQMSDAKNGIVTREMEFVANEERMEDRKSVV